jgi:phosphate transport system ATP-binding protein
VRSLEPSASRDEARPCIVASHLSAFFGDAAAVKDVSISIPQNAVTAIIGPSGCGKSTLLRCFNRMHETVPGTRVEGSVEILGSSIYGEGTSPIAVRRHVGMVFQRPTPFPTMSIRANVAAGLRVDSKSHATRGATSEIVEEALQRAGLWAEVKDQLDESAMALSGGQQQRLCIARALAVEPQALLLDEPASALDPIATSAIEDLIHQLKRDYTIVIVTHNMQQAARVADRTCFFSLSEEDAEGERAGILVEYDETQKIFTSPSDPRTEGYVTGRFG